MFAETSETVPPVGSQGHPASPRCHDGLNIPRRKHALIVMHSLAGRRMPQVTNTDGMVVGALSKAAETTMYGAGR